MRQECWCSRHTQRNRWDTRIKTLIRLALLEMLVRVVSTLGSKSVAEIEDGIWSNMDHNKQDEEPRTWAET